MKRTIIAFMLLLLSTTPAWALTDAEKIRQNEISECIEYFYLDPSAQNAERLFREIDSLGMVGEAFCFFNALFKHYPQQTFAWLDKAGIKIEQHSDLIYALWLSGGDRQALDIALKASWPMKNLVTLSQTPLPILEYKVDHPEYLKYMYGHFGVSGNPKYVSKMIDILDAQPGQKLDSAQLDVLKDISKNMLIALMFHHEIVYQQCLKESSVRRGDARRHLNELLETYDAIVKKSSLPEHNGMLNGDILITDSLTFEEEWNSLPIDSGPIGKSIFSFPYPTKDILIQFIPLFSGFELDSELNGKVAFDMEIYDPDGEQVAAFADMQGIHRKVASRFLVQKADATVNLKVDCSKGGMPEVKAPFTKVGIYKIHTTIRDHVGKKELKIVKTLEILPPDNES